MFVNVFTKPITLKGLFEKEQMTAFNELKANVEQKLNESKSVSIGPIIRKLFIQFVSKFCNFAFKKTDQAKKEMNKMAEGSKTSDDKANFIKELKDAKPVEYFEKKAFEQLKSDLEQNLDDAYSVCLYVFLYSIRKKMFYTTLNILRILKN